MSKKKKEGNVSDGEYKQDLDLLSKEVVTEFWENSPSHLGEEAKNKRGARKSVVDENPRKMKVKPGISDKDPDNQSQKKTRRRYGRNAELSRRHDRERQRHRRQNETEEERRIRLDKNKEAQRLRRQHQTDEAIMKRRKRDREAKQLLRKTQRQKSEEQRQKDKIRQFLYRANLTKEQRKEMQMKKWLYWYSLPQEKREEASKRYVEAQRNRRHNFTKEEKERYMVSVRRAIKKYSEKRKQNPELMEKYRAYMRTRHQKAIANETPEKRQKRLWGYKVNAAKSKLKKQLLKNGIPLEEIATRVRELHNQMWSQPLPATPPSKYKPRPRKNLTTACDKSQQETQSETLDYHSIVFHVIPDTPGDTTCSFVPQFAIQKLVVEEKNCGYQNEVVMDAADFEVHYTDPTTSPISQESQAFMSSSKNSCSNGGNMPDNNSPAPASPHNNTETCSREDQHEDMDEPSTFDHSIKCPHCPDEFSNDLDLRLHVKSQHFKLCWKCPKCQYVMLNPSEMSEHFRTIHCSNESDKHGSTFNCVKCPIQIQSPSSSFVQKRFLSIKDLYSHVRENHPEAYWPCPHCSILKYSEKKLKIHLKLCRKNKMKKV